MTATLATATTRPCEFCQDPISTQAPKFYDAEEVAWLPKRMARVWCDEHCYAGGHTDLHTGEIDLHAELISA